MKSAVPQAAIPRTPAPSWFVGRRERPGVAADGAGPGREVGPSMISLSAAASAAMGMLPPVAAAVAVSALATTAGRGGGLWVDLAYGGRPVRDDAGLLFEPGLSPRRCSRGTSPVRSRRTAGSAGASTARTSATRSRRCRDFNGIFPDYFPKFHTSSPGILRNSVQ